MKRLVPLLFILSISLAKAQPAKSGLAKENLPLLTLQEAIERVLANNYGLRIAKNDSAALAIENEFKNAAFLPRLNANTGLTLNNNDQYQKFSDGAIRERKGIQSENISAAVALNWTLFGGLRVYTMREKAQAYQQLGDLNLRNQVINTIAQVSNSYYAIVQQRQQLKALEEQIEINQERVKLAATKLEIGTGTKPDLLQSKVDLNAQKAAQLEQQNVLIELKNELNNLMNQSPGTTFEVEDSIPFTKEIALTDLQENVATKSLPLQVAKKNIDIAALNLKEQKAERWPQINFNSNYNFTRLDNKAVVNPFQPLFNRNKGFNYGLTATIPLSNNLILRKNITQAKLDLKRQELVYENQRNQLNLAVVQAYNQYQSSKSSYQLEEENIQLAKENVRIVLEVYRLNSTTLIQLKEAQKSLQDAYTRLIRARFQTKLAETELLRLKGEL
ncbi:MAG TPA: TolC family protein [Chitinophagaceae bacterium]|nr:TolC family protein [Chitinophagaceae bacterium]